LPPAAAILRRALVLWGLGHLSLGDRRGLVLLVLQPIAIGSLLVASLSLLDGTHWIAVLPAIALVLAVWIGQAVHAHQRAVTLGAAPGGELQIAWLLPLVVAAVTCFWLLGGHHGSVGATVREYVDAWRSGHAAAATPLFTQSVDADELNAIWLAQARYLEEQIAAAANVYGPASGLDPTAPFAGLRFSQLASPEGADTAVVAVDIVRHQRIETTLFGIIPTASQVTLPVARAGTIQLRAQPAAQPLGLGWLPAPLRTTDVWLIENVALP
jgi:hypothetical protein